MRPLCCLARLRLMILKSRKVKSQNPVGSGLTIKESRTEGQGKEDSWNTLNTLSSVEA